MKSGISTIALVAVLAAPIGALATDFTWNGNTSPYWDEPNWSVGGFGSQNYPGQNQAGDTATINADTSNDTVILDIGLTYEVKTVDVDADNAGVSLTLDIRSTGALDTSGLVTIKSSLAGTPEATIKVASTTSPYFKPAAMRFWGRNHASSGHAKLDADAGFTVDNDLTVRQYADFDVAGGKTVAVDGNLRIGKDLDDYFGYLTLTGGGTVQAGTVIIEGQSGADPVEESTLEVSSGFVLSN